MENNQAIYTHLFMLLLTGTKCLIAHYVDCSLSHLLHPSVQRDRHKSKCLLDISVVLTWECEWCRYEWISCSSDVGVLVVVGGLITA